MKTSNLTKRFISVLALLMAMVMLFSACKGKGENNNSSSSDVASDSADNTDDNNNNNDDVSNATDSNGSNKNKSTSSKKSKKGKSNKGNSNTGASTSGGNYTWGSNPYANIPASVKEKGVHLCMWRELDSAEKKVVEDFQKKTGIKVRFTVGKDNQYTQKIISLITAKDSPDVVMFENTTFPGTVVRALQPLDAKTFRLSDSIWDKSYLDAFKINGKYFGVAINGSIDCYDTAYVTYYNKETLKQAGVSTTPYQLYKQGKWNWDAQKDIATKVKQNIKSVGYAQQNADTYMLSAGVDFVKYDGSKFTNQLGSVSGSSMLTKSWSALATLNTNKVSDWWDLSTINSSKVGLWSAITYGLLKDAGWYKNMNNGGLANMEAVPVAGPTQSTAYTPVRAKVWGVTKNAKNPEGAAYFLRYFLDPSNLPSNVFANNQFKEIYNTVSNKNTKKCIAYASGVGNYLTSKNYGNICGVLYSATPANVNKELNARKGEMQTPIARANKDLARIK